MFAGQKVNTKIYTYKHKQFKNESFIILQLTFKITFQSTKYLGVNLKEEVQHCYIENDNTQLKEFKDYLTKYL